MEKRKKEKKRNKLISFRDSKEVSSQELMGSVKQSQIIGSLIRINILTIMIYIYITVMGKSTNFFIFKNSKLKSKIGCYQIYLLKKLRK